MSACACRASRPRIVWPSAATWPIASDSIVQGGFPGANITAIDPQFDDVANGDYRLAAGSPAIDAGVNANMPSIPGTEFDVAGNPLIVDGLGANYLLRRGAG